MPPASPARLDRVFRGPPEEEFWERYNRRLEFPLSTAAAVLLHLAVAALVVFLLARMMNDRPDRSAVPVTLVEACGPDDLGASPAGVGERDPKTDAANPFTAEREQLPNPAALDAIKEDIRRVALDDPAAPLPIAAPNAAGFEKLDDALKKQFLGRRGGGAASGTGPGSGGADSTNARSLRWVLRFRTTDGADYVRQLAAMGASVLVPLPPENKQCLLVGDLRNPAPRPATDDDLKSLAGQIKFSDTRPGSVAGVCAALRVTQPAQSFWAFFPRGLEDELARKERAYRNRRPEDIAETVFQVVVRDGSYEVVVIGQTVLR